MEILKFKCRRTESVKYLPPCMASLSSISQSTVYQRNGISLYHYFQTHKLKYDFPLYINTHISIGTQEQRLTSTVKLVPHLKKQAGHINHCADVNSCRQYRCHWTAHGRRTEPVACSINVWCSSDVVKTMSLCTSYKHMWGGGRAPLNLNFSTSSRWAVSFNPRSLYPLERSCVTCVTGGWLGPTR